MPGDVTLRVLQAAGPRPYATMRDSPGRDRPPGWTRQAAGGMLPGRPFSLPFSLPPPHQGVADAVEERTAPRAPVPGYAAPGGRLRPASRSEEHPSEIQSLF